MKNLGIVTTPQNPPRKPSVDIPLRNGLALPRLKQDTELNEANTATFANIQGAISDNAVLVAAFDSKQNLLGYVPLNPAFNLADLDDIPTARAVLGLVAGGPGDIWLNANGDVMTGTLVLGSQYPLQFVAAALQAGIAAGMLEFDGRQLYFSPLDARKNFSLLSDAIVAAVAVNNTVTETAVFSVNIPTDMLNIAQIIRLILYGHYSTANGTDTFTLKFKIDGATILSIASTAAVVSNAPIAATLQSTIRSIGGAGTMWSFIEAAINNVKKDVPGLGTTSIDTTQVLTLQATIQWSAADPGNVLSIDQTLLNMS